MKGEEVEVIPLGILGDRRGTKKKDCKHTKFIDLGKNAKRTQLPNF